MNTVSNIRNTNRFWQQCQRFDIAQRNERHENIKTNASPQVGGSIA
jgi:hypothetical protein